MNTKRLLTKPTRTTYAPRSLALQRQAGVSLVLLVIIASFVMLAVIFASINLAQSSLNTTSDQKDVLRAQYTAEAGVQYAALNYNYMTASIPAMKPTAGSATENPKFADFQTQLEKLCDGGKQKGDWKELFNMSSGEPTGEAMTYYANQGDPYSRIKDADGVHFCYAKDPMSIADMSLFQEYLKANADTEVFKEREIFLKTFGVDASNLDAYTKQVLTNLFESAEPDKGKISVNMSEVAGNKSKLDVSNVAKMTAITFLPNWKIRIHYYIPQVFSTGESEGAVRVLSLNGDDRDYYIEITAPGIAEGSPPNDLTSYAYYMETRGAEDSDNSNNPLDHYDYFEGRVHTNAVLQFSANLGGRKIKGSGSRQNEEAMISDSATFNGVVTSAGCRGTNTAKETPTCATNYYYTGKYEGGVLPNNGTSLNGVSKVHDWHDKNSYYPNGLPDANGAYMGGPSSTNGGPTYSASQAAFGDTLSHDGKRLPYERQIFNLSGEINPGKHNRSVRIGWLRNHDGSVTAAPAGIFEAKLPTNPLRKIPRKSVGDYTNIASEGIRIVGDVSKLKIFKDEKNYQIFEITQGEGRTKTTTKLAMDSTGKMMISDGDTWEMAKMNSQKEPINWEVTTDAAEQAGSARPKAAVVLYVDGTIKSLTGPERSSAMSKVPNTLPAVASFANLGIIARQNIVISGDLKYEKKVCDLSAGAGNAGTACETNDGVYTGDENWIPDYKHQNILGIVALGLGADGKKINPLNKQVDAASKAGIALANSCSFYLADEKSPRSSNRYPMQSTDGSSPNVPYGVEIDAFLYAPNGSFGFNNTKDVKDTKEIEGCDNDLIYFGNVKVRGGAIVNSVGTFDDSNVESSQSYIYDPRGQYISPVGLSGNVVDTTPKWLNWNNFTVSVKDQDMNAVFNGQVRQASVEDKEEVLK